MRFALILSLLIAIVAVIFALYNPHTVDVDLVYRVVPGPLALVIIISLLAGVVAGILASLPSIIRRGAEVRRLRKRLVGTEGREPVVVERAAPAPPPEERLTRKERRAEERRAAEEDKAAEERRAADERRAAEERRAREEPGTPTGPAADEGAAETQRLAEETHRMAAEARLRAEEAERRAAEAQKRATEAERQGRPRS